MAVIHINAISNAESSNHADNTFLLLPISKRLKSNKSMKKFSKLAALFLATSISVAYAKETLSVIAPPYEVGFSPNAGAEDLVVKVIGEAQATIRLGAYSFTSTPVIKALIAAKKRGVDVQCVLDKSNVHSKSGIAAANLLVGAGIATRIDFMHPIHHNKFMVIDGETLETGSFNYSAQAAHKNAENALVIRRVPDLAQTYTANWALHWEHSVEYKSTF